MMTIKVYNFGVFEVNTQSGQYNSLSKTFTKGNKVGKNFGVMMVHHNREECFRIIREVEDQLLDDNNIVNFYLSVTVMSLDKYVDYNNINLTVEDIAAINKEYGTSYKKFDY